MAGLVPAVQVFDIAVKRRECPAFAGHEGMVSIEFKRVNVSVGRYYRKGFQRLAFGGVRGSAPRLPLSRAVTALLSKLWERVQLD